VLGNSLSRERGRKADTTHHKLASKPLGVLVGCRTARAGAQRVVLTRVAADMSRLNNEIESYSQLTQRGR